MLPPFALRLMLSKGQEKGLPLHEEEDNEDKDQPMGQRTVLFYLSPHFRFDSGHDIPNGVHPE